MRGLPHKSRKGLPGNLFESSFAGIISLKVGFIDLEALFGEGGQKITFEIGIELYRHRYIPPIWPCEFSAFDGIF